MANNIVAKKKKKRKERKRKWCLGKREIPS